MQIAIEDLVTIVCDEFYRQHKDILQLRTDDRNRTYSKYSKLSYTRRNKLFSALVDDISKKSYKIKNGKITRENT